MPIKIGGGKPSAPPAPPSQTPDTSTDLSGLGTGASPQHTPQAHAPSAPSSGNASFLMTGSKQHQEVNRVRAQQDLRAKLRGGFREFYLKPGEFARLYFLDGAVSGDGVFDTPMVVTHLMQIGGNWTRFVCPKAIEGNCIVCDSNADQSRPDTLQLFTVLNTMPYTIQNGPRKGTVLQARVQLFAATIKVRTKLMQKAETRGGTLAGKLWQFSRSDNQSARTGDDVEYIDTYPMDAVLKKYPYAGDVDPNTKKPTATAILDYTQSYPILTNADIAVLRPDIGYSAGYAGAPATPGTGAMGGQASVGDIGDDEIPF